MNQAVQVVFGFTDYVEEFTDVFFVLDVYREAQCVRSCFGQFRDTAVYALGIQIDGDDPGTFAGTAEASGSTDAGGGAGDEDGLLCEFGRNVFLRLGTKTGLCIENINVR